MRSPKVPQETLSIKMAGSAEEAFAHEAAAIRKQKTWARSVADGIEHGKLPSAKNERQVIAWIVRKGANRAEATKPAAKRGNPGKTYDPDRVALEVGFRIGFGDEPSDAILNVAIDLDLDRSTVAKIFRTRRNAVAQWFMNSNLAHRVGAIRGNSA